MVMRLNQNFKFPLFWIKPCNFFTMTQLSNRNGNLISQILEESYILSPQTIVKSEASVIAGQMSKSSRTRWGEQRQTDGPMLQHYWLSCHLQYQYPLWAVVHGTAASLSIQLLTAVLGKVVRRWFKYLGQCQAQG